MPHDVTFVSEPSAIDNSVECSPSDSLGPVGSFVFIQDMNYSPVAGHRVFVRSFV